MFINTKKPTSSSFSLVFGFSEGITGKKPDLVNNMGRKGNAFINADFENV